MRAVAVKRRHVLAALGLAYVVGAGALISSFLDVTRAVEDDLSALPRGLFTVLIQTEQQVTIMRHNLEGALAADRAAPETGARFAAVIRQIEQLQHRAALFRRAGRMTETPDGFVSRYAPAVNRYFAVVDELREATVREAAAPGAGYRAIERLLRELEIVTTYISTIGRDALNQQSQTRADNLSTMTVIALAAIVAVLVILFLLATALVAVADAAARLKRSKESAEATLAELRETKTQLVQAEKMASLGSLVAGVAHEVNTPVGVAVTASSVLTRQTRAFREKLGQGRISRAEFDTFLNDAGESADLIERNARRAAELIESFKKVAVDQTSDERRRFALGPYLRDVIRSLGPELRRRQVSAFVDAALDFEIESYPGALSQVVTNLTMNALVHAFPDQREGEIRIDGARDGDAVTLRYADNGVGMEEAVRSRVFDPFFTTRRGSGGSGLGMSVVYNLVVSRLGGEIDVQSRPGEGSVIRLRLPANVPEAAA